MGRFRLDQVDSIRNAMITEKTPFLKDWRDFSEFVSPNRFRLDERRRNIGGRNDEKIVNNVARRALRIFITGLMDGSTPSTREWFRIVTLNDSLTNRTEVKKYFREVEKIFNAFFQAGNLYRVLPMSYKDIGIFSNSAFGMLPHERFGFYFFPFSMGSYGISNDSEGNVTTFYRDFNMTVRQIVEAFLPLKETGHIDWTGKDPWLRTMWEEAHYMEQATLSNVILPNPSPKPLPFFPEDKVYQSYTYITALGGGVQTQLQSNRGERLIQGSFGQPTVDEFLQVKGYSYFPVIANRWEVPPEQDWGVDGPSEIALGDIKSLQSMESGRLDAVDKLLRPAMVGHPSLRRHQSTILPGGITYLDDPSGKQFRPAFVVDPKLAELINKSAEYEEAIKSAYFVDLFLKLSNQPRLSHVTKAETDGIIAETLSAVGPILGQLNQDQNRRIIDNAFIILEEQGQLPPKPKVLQGRELRPEYISTLALAQKASKLNETERYVGFVTGTAQALGDPSLLAMVKGEDTIRIAAELIGVDPSMVPDEAEFAEAQKAIALAQQQRAQQEAAAQQAQIAKDLAAAPVGDSNLLEMAGEQEQA